MASWQSVADLDVLIKEIAKVFKRMKKGKLGKKGEKGNTEKEKNLKL